MLDRAALVEMTSFLERRLGEEVLIADDVGDQLTADFARNAKNVLAAMRRDIDDRPWARSEIGNYLLRAVSRYRTHPEFRPWWALNAPDDRL